MKMVPNSQFLVLFLLVRYSTLDVGGYSGLLTRPDTAKDAKHELSVPVLDQSDDVMVSREYMGHLLTRLTDLENKVSAMQQDVSKSVAFYARTNRDPFDVGSQDIVILNDVITNVGYAYDGNTDVFRAPYNGTYFFAYSMVNSPDHDAYVYVEVDGKRQTTDYVVHKYTTSTAHLTLRLNVGQTLYLVNLNDTYLRGGDYTIFSGFLIQAEV